MITQFTRFLSRPRRRPTCNRSRAQPARRGRDLKIELLEDRVLPFWPGGHSIVTTTALPFLNLGVLATIVRENLAEDRYQVQERHFDNSAFQQSAARINDLYESARGAADPNAFQSEQVETAFGRLLHTAQDFYSHSNWVEHGLTGAMVESGNSFWNSMARTPDSYKMIKGVLLVQGPAPDGVTFERDPLDRRVIYVQVGSNLLRGIVTGGYPSALDNLAPFDDLPHDIMNKDTFGRPGYFAALYTAYQQTRHEFGRLCRIVGAEYGPAGVNRLIQEWVGGDSDSQRRARDLCGGNFVSVVEVIDRSGSMAGGRIDAAKSAASLFVDMMNTGDKIGVASYATSASVDFPLTQITVGSDVKVQARAAISRLAAGGATSIGAGVRAADGQLDRFRTDPARAMIVMTDGLHNTAPHPIDVINSEVDPDIRIFTVGFGSGADSNLLTQMAALRNGQYFFAPSEAELQQIYTLIAGALGGDQATHSMSGNLGPGDEDSSEFDVDPSSTDMTVGLNWPGSDLDLSLIAPDGSVINHETARDDPNIELIIGPTYEFYKIKYPQIGRWQARMRAISVPPQGEPYNLLATVKAAVMASAQTLDAAGNPKISFRRGETVNLRVGLSDGMPIHGAAVRAVVSLPIGLAFVTSLHDDGLHNDLAADDGIYGTTFMAGLAGTYGIQVEARGRANLGFEFTRLPSTSMLVTQSGLGPGDDGDGWAGANLFEPRHEAVHSSSVTALSAGNALDGIGSAEGSARRLEGDVIEAASVKRAPAAWAHHDAGGDWIFANLHGSGFDIAFDLPDEWLVDWSR